MTGSEMATVMTLIGSLWPYAEVERRYAAGAALLLGDLPVDEVVAAVRSLAVGDPPALKAREFPPPPGIVRAQVEEARRSARFATMLEAGRA